MGRTPKIKFDPKKIENITKDTVIVSDDTIINVHVVTPDELYESIKYYHGEEDPEFVAKLKYYIDLAKETKLTSNNSST